MRCRWRSARAATPRWCATARRRARSPRSSTCRATIRPARCSPRTRIDDDGDIILRRVQTADGRTRVFVNDQPSSVALMRDIGRALVEIHGQHDERALVDAGAHRDLLDAFGGHRRRGAARAGAPGGAGARPSRSLPRHRAKVEAARARGRLSARRRSPNWRKLDPQPGEETELAEPRAGDDAGREDRRPRSTTRRTCCPARTRRCRSWPACCAGCSARRPRRRACSTRWSSRSTRR